MRPVCCIRMWICATLRAYTPTTASNNLQSFSKKKSTVSQEGTSCLLLNMAEVPGHTDPDPHSPGCPGLADVCLGKLPKVQEFLPGLEANSTLCIQHSVRSVLDSPTSIFVPIYFLLVVHLFYYQLPNRPTRQGGLPPCPSRVTCSCGLRRKAMLDAPVTPEPGPCLVPVSAGPLSCRPRALM
jgi:hypothetical protein